MNHAERRPIDYVYILAASHSGSTLTALLLNAHPDIVSVGEIVSGSMRDLDGYRCSCRRLIVECPFWAAVTATLRPKHPDFDLSDFGIRLDPERPPWVSRAMRAEHRGPFLESLRDGLLAASPTFRRHIADVERHLYAFATAILRERAARVVADSSKLAHRLKFLLRMPSFNVKVVHLVRDGRAVALTYMDEQQFADASDPRLRRGGRGSVEAGRKMDMERAAGEWQRAAVGASNLLRRLDPSRWTRITYEQLCQEPDAVLRRLFEFIGVDAARRRRDFRGAEPHIVGNGMRLDATSEIRLDERWRTVLTPDELVTFDRAAGEVNRRFGYA